MKKHLKQAISMSNTLGAEDFSNEYYFISRTKKSLETNIYEAKSWILTAKSLFPQHFQILFESYLVEKLSKDAEKAAKCFAMLFQSFMSENDLFTELNNIVAAVLSENPTAEETFLKEMFCFIPLSVQHDILSVALERSQDALEYCQLVLIMLNKFPYTVPKLAIRVVETLLTAEKQSLCQNAINSYREVLVHDVIPTLLEKERLELPTKLLVRMMHKMIGFYISYYMNQALVKKEQDTRDTFDGLDNKNKEEDTKKHNASWEKMFFLLTEFGKRLDWELCSVFIYPWDRDITWQNMMSFNNVVANSPDSGKPVKQLVLCLTVFFTYYLCQYTYQIHAKTKKKNPLVLVEAFSNNQTLEPLAKMPKTSILDPKTVITVGCETRDVMKHFMFTTKCWGMLHSTELLQKEFLKLKQHLRLDQWLSEFVFDIGLYYGKFDDISVDKLSDTTNMRTALKKLSYYYCLKNNRLIVDHALNVVKLLDTVTDFGSCHSSMTKQAVRHLCFLPIERLPILQYVVKILINVLKPSLRLKNVDTNYLYSQLLVLSQFNWPSEEHLAKDIILRIKKSSSFTFHSFFKYIVEIEILEQFMQIVLEDKNGAIKLDIMSIHSPITFNGDDKKDFRENLRKMIRAQVNRSNESVYTIIYNFLSQEENIKFFI